MERCVDDADNVEDISSDTSERVSYPLLRMGMFELTEDELDKLQGAFNRALDHLKHTQKHRRSLPTEEVGHKGADNNPSLEVRLHFNGRDRIMSVVCLEPGGGGYREFGVCDSRDEGEIDILDRIEVRHYDPVRGHVWKKRDLDA